MAEEKAGSPSKGASNPDQKVDNVISIPVSKYTFILAFHFLNSF